MKTIDELIADLQDVKAKYKTGAMPVQVFANGYADISGRLLVRHDRPGHPHVALVRLDFIEDKEEDE